VPGFLTHYLAGQSGLEKLGDVDPAYEKLFNLGTQGPDIFFYYAPGFVKERCRGVGSMIHHADFRKFFMEMARWTKQPAVFAYLTGFLVHYTVDVAAHPFVNACTENEGITDMQKSAAHRHFETVTDVLMLERLRGQQPSEIAQSKLIAAPKEQKQAAAVVFAQAVQKVYARGLKPQDVYHAMGYMTAITRMLESSAGRRKRAVAFFEDKLAGARIFSSMVHMQRVEETRDYLNLGRETWKEGRSESFPQLFEKAVAQAVRLITALDEYRRGEMPRRQLAQLIGNYSLSTGEKGV
jgi:hypothetical protein